MGRQGRGVTAGTRPPAVLGGYSTGRAGTDTLFFHTNHLPRLGDSTEAIRRRICKIEFPVKITEAERDEQLPAKLEGEAAGILRWAVEGFLQYRG